MAAVPRLRGRRDGAICLKKLREAALSDDNGEKLAIALSEVAK